MKNLKDIQEVLNKKAEVKLKKDIETYLNAFSSNPFFGAFSGLKGLYKEFPDRYFSDWIKKNWDDSAGDKIFKAFIDKYIENETKEFMQRVGEIKSQMSELDEIINF